MTEKSEKIKQLLDQGKSYREIMGEVKCSKGTISFHSKVIKSPSAGNRYNWSEVQEFYDTGATPQECFEKFGMSEGGWYRAGTTGKLKLRKFVPVAVPMDSYTSRAGIRRRIIRDNIFPYCCSKCGTEPVWQGKALELVLDHINGKNNDHRIENLRWLCPNCNSQTETFAGRNVKKKY